MISILQANQATVSVESMYYGFIFAGQYFPSIPSSGVTSKICSELQQQCFSFESKRSTTKEEILHEIEKKLNGQELGFTDGDYPDRTKGSQYSQSDRSKSFFIQEPKSARLIQSNAI